jgi:hypothetical protein
MKLTDIHTCKDCIHSEKGTQDARGFTSPLMCTRYPKAKFVSSNYRCGEGRWILEEGHGNSHLWSYPLLVEYGYK